jgi:rhodanese-related sulfurtransferase
LKDLPIDREVIACCRGVYRVLSLEAVSQLRKKGFKARRLEEGYLEWKAAGLSVNTTS